MDFRWMREKRDPKPTGDFIRRLGLYVLKFLITHPKEKSSEYQKKFRDELKDPPKRT